jgi:hypothetical protein
MHLRKCELFMQPRVRDKLSFDKVLRAAAMKHVLLFVILTAACDNTPPAVVYDMATPADLTVLGGPGDRCKGNLAVPRECGPGLRCVGAINDISGICEFPDMGGCQANGAACNANGDCCTGNCVRNACCVAGGCP